MQKPFVLTMLTVCHSVSFSVSSLFLLFLTEVILLFCYHDSYPFNIKIELSHHYFAIILDLKGVVCNSNPIHFVKFSEYLLMVPNCPFCVCV